MNAQAIVSLNNMAVHSMTVTTAAAGQASADCRTAIKHLKQASSGLAALVVPSSKAIVKGDPSPPPVSKVYIRPATNDDCIQSNSTIDLDSGDVMISQPLVVALTQSANPMESVCLSAQEVALLSATLMYNMALALHLDCLATMFDAESCKTLSKAASLYKSALDLCCDLPVDNVTTFLSVAAANNLACIYSTQIQYINLKLILEWTQLYLTRAHSANTEHKETVSIFSSNRKFWKNPFVRHAAMA